MKTRSLLLAIGLVLTAAAGGVSYASNDINIPGTTINANASIFDNLFASNSDTYNTSNSAVEYRGETTPKDTLTEQENTPVLTVKSEFKPVRAYIRPELQNQERTEYVANEDLPTTPTIIPESLPKQEIVNALPETINNSSNEPVKNVEVEFEIAKHFFDKNGISYNGQSLSKSINATLSNSQFASLISKFLNQTMGGNTSISPDVTPTRGNLISIVGRSLFPACDTEQCYINKSQENGIVTQVDNDSLRRPITEYESLLLLWRSYITFKSNIFEKEGLDDDIVNLSNLVYGNVFGNVDIVSIADSYFKPRNNVVTKGYGETMCNYDENTNSMRLMCGNNSHPSFYIIEINKDKQTMHELTSLGAKVRQLYTSETTLY